MRAKLHYLIENKVRPLHEGIVKIPQHASGFDRVGEIYPNLIAAKSYVFSSGLITSFAAALSTTTIPFSGYEFDNTV
jgi:hypothetical protein